MMNWQVAIGGFVRVSSPENKLSFFVGRNQAQAAGSLISTYRVVNTTLRAESENKRLGR
jgi:hypothetical protein